MDFTKLKLGRLPAKHDLRTLTLSKYLPDTLPEPHLRVNWGAKLSNLGMMQNDALGICTIAAAGHMIQAWTANVGNQVVLPDSEIIRGYMGACGYDPKDPNTDRGGIELDVLNYWRKVGVGGRKIFAFAKVNWMNRKYLKLAIDLFGGVYTGIALPITAQGQEVWSVPAYGPHGQGAPGTWGGHAVPLVDYGPGGVTCITWGQKKTMSWKFVETYFEEAYAVLSTDWVDGTRTAPSGFAFDELQKDLAAITS